MALCRLARKFCIRNLILYTTNHFRRLLTNKSLTHFSSSEQELFNNQEVPKDSMRGIQFDFKLENLN